MNAMLGLLIPALLGVDYGWERKTDGTIAYVVQVDPETFAEMQRSGQAIGSSLPVNLRSRVSDFSFRVGREPLPNQNTLPPEALTPITDAATAKAGATPTYVKAEYPPATYPPSGSTSNGSTVVMPQTTTANWPVTPGSVPSVSLPPPGSANTSWAQNTVPASSSAAQPLSTSGFPINPNAQPPQPAGVYPTSPTSSNSSAWGNTTAPPSLSPPSLNNGPRITQPQPWSTPPREVTISARMPQEPSTPLSNTGVAPPNMNGPNLNNGGVPTAGNYPSNQPGYNNNGAYPTNAGYPPPNPQYATNNYPANGAAPPPPQPGYTANPNPSNQNAPNGSGWPQEPRSASANPPAAAVTTNNVATAADAKWLPFVVVLIGLLTSLTANFYFGWQKYQMSERLRMILADRGTF